MIKKITTSLLFPLILLSSYVSADNYDVSLTRKGDNLYKVDTKNIFVQTRYCYEYVYSENSILKLNGSYSSEIIFLDSKNRCDVKAIYSEVNQNIGKYSISVSQEENDWYEILGKNIFIKTNGCLNLALGEEAILDIHSSGYGTLYFKNDECMVEGIYAKEKL